MKKFVLDSYAVLAYFQNESGAQVVEKMLLDAENESVKLFMSVVNLGETVYITQRKSGEQGKQSLLLALDMLPIRIEDVTKDLALRAADLKAKYSISYADCFTAALALSHEVPAVTGDPEFKKIEHLVTIKWV